MRPRFNMAGSLAGAVLLASGLVGSAFGQEFRLGETGLTAHPGETLQVRLLVSGGPTQTSAVNFTVAVEGTNAQYVSAIDGDKAGDFAAFSIAENSPTRAGGKEYRAVIYAPSGVSPIDTTGSKQVATIFVTIAGNAPANTVIDLKLDKVGGAGTGFDNIDATTKLGLVGISDSAGVSKVPSGTPSTVRPARVGTNITVQQAVTPALVDVNFDGATTITDRWEFAQQLPAPATQRLRGTNQNPYMIEVLGDNTFGYLATKGSASTRVVPTAANTILFFSWRASANKANAVDVAPVRLRASAGDGSTAATATFAEIGSNGNATNPVLIPSAGNFKTLTSAIYAPNEVIDNVGGKGFVMAFDIVNFVKPSGVGTVFNVTDFVTQEVPVGSLTGEAEIYTRDFSVDPSGFTASTLPIANGGLDASTSTTGGLTVNPSGGIVYGSGGFGDPDPLTGKFPGLSYSYGIWNGLVTGWQVATNKIYRVDYTLSSSAPSRDQANQVRLRFRAGSAADYVYTTEISSAGASRTQFPPDADGESYTSFVLFPNELAGQNVRFFLDVYAVDPADTGSVTLKNMHVRSYDMPTLTNTP